jgi:hypothetical protein
MRVSEIYLSTFNTTQALTFPKTLASITIDIYEMAKYRSFSVVRFKQPSSNHYSTPSPRHPSAALKLATSLHQVTLRTH